MKLDLSDVEAWSDEDVVEALDEHDNLNSNGEKWAGILSDAFGDYGHLTPRQREIGVKILREQNGD